MSDPEREIDLEAGDYRQIDPPRREPAINWINLVVMVASLLAVYAFAAWIYAPIFNATARPALDWLLGP